MINVKSSTFGGVLVGIAVSMSVFFAPHCLANESWYEVAEQAAREGRLPDMQSAYEQVLLAEPRSIRAMAGRAAALAWQQRYEDAQLAYTQALLVDPQNLDVLTGLGYAYAWDADYSRAHTQFRRALRIDPVNSSARKGIAYSYYWAGDFELALESLEIAKSIDPDDAEIAEASGQVQLSLGRSRDALESFERALVLDPTRKSARTALRNAGSSAPALEFTSRFGSTSNAGSGVRVLEFAHWPARDTRLAFRYDDSLSLDNSALVRRGENAPGYFASFQRSFLRRWTVALEIGRRLHVDGDENLLSLQSSYASSAGVIRVGATVGHHSAGHSDEQVFGGFNFPLGERWRLEPTVYVSRAGANGDTEWRSVLNAEFVTDRIWKAGGFIGTGSIDAADAAFDGRTTVAGLWGSVLLANRHSLQLSVRNDSSPTTSFTISELSFTFRLPGN